jgi:hypothetical protein
MSDLIPDPEDPTQYLIGDATDVLIGAHQGVAVLENVHPASACEGESCVVHNPSKHHMRSWPLVWRDDKGVMERTCPHGVGHPDPDDAGFLIRTGREHLTIHGCDLCCGANG